MVYLSEIYKYHYKENQMFNKHRLTIPAAVLLVNGALASAESKVGSSGSKCTGEFHEEINTLYMRCNNEETGATESTQEHFYDSLLGKECETLTFGDLQNLYGEDLPKSLEEDQEVEVCDYYEAGSGYQFSIVDNEIGLLMIEGKKESERNDYYLNLNATSENINWNWSEL